MWLTRVRKNSAAAAAILLMGIVGCKANPPGKFETNAMTFAKHHIFIGGKKQKNPLPDSAGTIADGKEAFSHYCVVCHGMDGQKYRSSFR